MIDITRKQAHKINAVDFISLLMYMYTADNAFVGSSVEHRFQHYL